MRISTHIKIAKEVENLLKCREDKLYILKSFELCVLELGSIEPDIIYRTFRHTSEKSIRHLEHIIGIAIRTKNRIRLTLTFGIIIHHISDYMCTPHKINVGVINHIRYENKLHTYVAENRENRENKSIIKDAGIVNQHRSTEEEIEDLIDTINRKSLEHSMKSGRFLEEYFRKEQYKLDYEMAVEVSYETLDYILSIRERNNKMLNKDVYMNEAEVKETCTINNMDYTVEVEGNKAEVHNYGKNNRALKNRAEIIGNVVSPLVFEYESHRECFYSTDIEVERLSGNKDIINVMVSDRLIDVNMEYVGKIIKVMGLLRTYKSGVEDAEGRIRSSYKTYVFASEVEEINPNISYDRENNNLCFLEGVISKKEEIKETNSGRQVLRFILKVGRKYDKSDTIKCIAWGRNAKYLENKKVGDEISIEGRTQSREIIKRAEGEEGQRLGRCIEVSVKLAYSV